MGQSGSSPAEEASQLEHPNPTEDQVREYKEMKPDEVPPADAKVILVIGAAGAGKTSLIRLATGANIPVGNDTQAGTVACQTYTATVQGHQLALIDCPGLNGDDSDLALIGWIGRYICDLFRHGRSLHGILYLHDINIVRKTPAMERCLKLVEVITDRVGYPNITFVTTKWDGLSQTRRIACHGYHNNLTDCRQWQIFRSNGARDCLHDGLDDLPNPSGDALQAARVSVLNVLQFYLNNPSRMPLHLETQFRQRNQNVHSTIQWLLSSFTRQQRPAGTDDSGWSFSEWVVPVAVIATLTGAFSYNQARLGNIRGRPTWDGKYLGFRIYIDDKKKAKFYESWINDFYRQLREQNPLLPERRPSELFSTKTLDLNPRSHSKFSAHSPLSGLDSNSSSFKFDSGGPSRDGPSSRPTSLNNAGARSPLNGLGFDPSPFKFGIGGPPSLDSSGRLNFANLNGVSRFTNFNPGGRFSSDFQ